MNFEIESALDLVSSVWSMKRIDRVSSCQLTTFFSNLTGGINFGNNNVGIDNNGVNGGGFGNDEGIDPDINCDRLGTCYDVGVHCKDTRIVVNVNTNQPFSGRIYALGRSETCNVDVINSDSFRLDLTMSGQDCNTQSVVSTPQCSDTNVHKLLNYYALS